MSNLKRDAIASLVPNSFFNINTDGSIYSSYPAVNSLTEEEIQAEMDRLESEYDALAWKRSRQAEYPSIQELVVALYDTDDKADIEAKRAAVKAKYPKPE